MKKTSLLLLALLAVLTFESCDNTPPPVINLISPEEGAELYIGGGVHFVAELSDSIMLSSYTIELLANDGDEYSKSRNPEKTPITAATPTRSPSFFLNRKPINTTLNAAAKTMPQNMSMVRSEIFSKDMARSPQSFYS